LPKVKLHERVLNSIRFVNVQTPYVTAKDKLFEVGNRDFIMKEFIESVDWFRKFSMYEFDSFVKNWIFSL
jgi:hypothetical protein